jgi:RNA polymerase sigma factor (sigma-70 family)
MDIAIVHNENLALTGRIERDPDSTLADLYKLYKSDFMCYIRQFGGVDEEHLDSYHDAVLGFYDVWVSGRYDAQRASIKTLLFTIGKYKLLTRKSRQHREPAWGDLESAGEVIEVIEADERTEDMVAINAAMCTLGKGCQKIIKLFYYQRYSISDIASLLKYKNENVVKAHKSRCMKQLRKRVMDKRNM